jgi:hypothetical protein
MNEDADLRAWCRARAEAEAPEGFADDVMAAVTREDEKRDAGVLVPWLTGLLRSRPGRAAVLLLGLGAFAVRVVGTLALFFTGDF